METIDQSQHEEVIRQVMKQLTQYDILELVKGVSYHIPQTTNPLLLNQTINKWMNHLERVAQMFLLYVRTNGLTPLQQNNLYHFLKERDDPNYPYTSITLYFGDRDVQVNFMRTASGVQPVMAWENGVNVLEGIIDQICKGWNMQRKDFLKFENHNQTNEL